MTNSSSSSGSTAHGRNRGRVVGVPKRCWCGERVEELISKSDQNPHRRYFRCWFSASRKLVNDPHVFKWVDEAHLDEIEKLQRATLKLEEEVTEMRRRDVEFENMVYEKVKTKLEEDIFEKVEEKMLESEWKIKKMMLLVVFASVVTIGIIKIIG